MSIAQASEDMEALSDQVRELVLKAPDLVRRVLTTRHDERVWQIIDRRFGLTGARRLTLEEIGAAFQVSRERIRQLEATAMRTLVAELITATTDTLLSESDRAATQVLHRTVSNTPQDAVREDTLLVSLRLDGKTYKVGAALDLLFALGKIHRAVLSVTGVPPLWCHWDSSRRNKVERTLRRLYTVTTREQVVPVDEFDLLVALNSHVKRENQISLHELHALMDLCDFLERTAEGRVQAQFHVLQGRGNQAYRLLTEAAEDVKVFETRRARD